MPFFHKTKHNRKPSDSECTHNILPNGDSDISIYLPPSIRHFEPRLIEFSAWIDHLPFGYDIVEALKPNLLVELGTEMGLSYFTFCQSVKEHDLDTICYAVDTWQGDDHTDAYDESVFQKVSQHNREHYHGFSYLLRILFNDALHQFSDDSIDLLHIDGYHTHEAVSKDFHDWLPKVRPGGLMLFHDITTRVRKDFGVWKFWEECSREYESFSFHHGYGLGVIRKAGGQPINAPLLRLLFGGNEREHQKLRQFYVYASRYLSLKRKVGSGQFGKARKPKQTGPAE